MAASETHMTLLKVNNFALKRGERELFQGLNLEISPGSVTAVIGPNGAGKSTFLMALAGVFEPVSGECILQGRAITDYSRAKVSKLIAWQGELPPTEFGLTVEQRLKLAAMENSYRAMIHHAASQMDIDFLMQRSLGELSSGERQRVEIASVMLRDCPIWLFDEPTSHLDLQHQVACLKMFRSEAEKGRAIVTVLHDIQQASSVADMVVLIDGEGGVEYGEVQSMMVAGKLESIFRIKLTTHSFNGSTVHLPDYRPDTGDR
ncbi:MAG: ABC transporter ATP-binding protein [Mariprofundaceae bacterium]